MSRLFRLRPASPGGGGALLGIVCLFCLMAALCFPPLLQAADDWLKVEEEKPLFGESAPRAQPAPAPAPGESAPQADLQKQAEAMKRYLKRFRDAINEATKLLDKREGLVVDLEGRCKAFEAVYKQYGTKAKEVIEDAWQQLKKYDPLVKNDSRFKFQDPGRDPGIKTRGDKLIENGGKLCEMARKWAKSKDKQERDRLKGDITKLRDETKQKQDRLKADFQGMVSAMKPIYRALVEARKKMTPAEKQKLIARYGQIISAVLEAQPVAEGIDQTFAPYERQVQKAKDASNMVLHYLNNHPKLPGVPNPQAIRNEVKVSATLAPLSARAEQLYKRRQKCAYLSGLYQKLKDGPGIAAVKLAKDTNNWVAIYSSSKDIYSQATNEMVDIMHRSGLAVEDIEKRKQLIDSEWQRSRDSLRESAKCVKKWMSIKPVRYFKGSLQQGFSARLISVAAGAKCPSRSAQCQNVSAQVEALADAENNKLRISAQKVPGLYIKSKSGRGLYCDGRRGSYRFSYDLKYDPASGSATLEGKNLKIQGRVSGSGFVFEEERTFQNSGGGCGPVKYLVQTRGKLKEASPEESSRALDEAGETLDALLPPGFGEDGASSAP